MLAVHHYFSSLKLLALITLSLLLGACASTGSDLISQVSGSRAVAETAPKPNLNIQPKTEPLTIPDILAKNNEKYRRPVILPARGAVARSNRSSWCTYLTQSAAADATILRAPTVSASINRRGNMGVAVNYDLMSIAKAELIDAAAQAKCRRYTANAALNRMAVAAPNVLSRQGYLAKSRVINQQAKKLRALKTLVRRELVTGDLDRAQATKLLLATDSLIGDGATAASEASKRQGLVAFDLENLTQLSQQLFKAERDLADINSNIRTTDALSVNLGGGWREAGKEAGAIVPKSDFYGGVNFSIKLGALNPARFAYEDAAMRARLRAYRDEPGGVFWKLDELEKAQRQGRSGIARNLSTLVASQAVARRQKSNLPANDPGFLVLRYGTEIELIRLAAEIAGTRATLAQIDRNIAKLRRMRYPA